jgi:hypothetical protein
MNGKLPDVSPKAMQVATPPLVVQYDGDQNREPVSHPARPGTALEGSHVYQTATGKKHRRAAQWLVDRYVYADGWPDRFIS